MDIRRISVKFFLADPASLDLELVLPVFHRWIQEHRVEGLLVDVADYRHVIDGPGVLLIGNDADYSLDRGGGRPGLAYARKRAFAADLPATLRQVFRGALEGCRLIESEPALRLRFRTDEAKITFLDRLRAPNRPETFERLKGDIEAVSKKLYPRGSVTPWGGDPREPLAVRVGGVDAADAAGMIARLG